MKDENFTEQFDILAGVCSIFKLRNDSPLKGRLFNRLPQQSWNKKQWEIIQDEVKLSEYNVAYTFFLPSGLYEGMSFDEVLDKVEEKYGEYITNTDIVMVSVSGYPAIYYYCHKAMVMVELDTNKLFNIPDDD